jgi:phosphotransferase family enzyme
VTVRPPPRALPAPRRVLLGPADVTDDELAAFVAADLGVRHATVLTSSAKVFPYDRPAITTAGRYLVTGSARSGAGDVRVFSFFVKVIHAYQRSPLRFAVPEHLRAQVAALVPWRTEADLYRSDLRDRLPDGLTVPRGVAVRDLDEDSAALWLEHVPARRVAWDIERHARTAYLLGRLAACRAVMPLATAVHGARTPRIYANAWLAHVVLPALTGDGVWAHPLVRDAFDARLRHRLLTAADALPALLDELDDVPAATAHGDACTANLLVADNRDAVVMVDFGFCGRALIGTDLGQLILGEVQTGQRPAADLPHLEAACLPAYVAGVHAEGGTADPVQVRRTHATLMTVFSALPSIPIEHLDDEPTPRLRRLFHGRAAIARFVLDLLDDTRPVRRVVVARSDRPVSGRAQSY